MSELAKTYEPAAVEAKWYDYWLQHGCFTADPSRVSAQRPAYSIVIPPPNVTGVLTLGHVLNNTIQDILARHARMLGKEVLWLPGTDHAGIATQNVVEKTLRKEGVMKHRDDLGREALVAKIWEWKEKYGGIIIQQLKKLGASCDWSRERFTMDPEYSQCVSRVFVDLYKKGLIYRGKRMVNWCPASLTALSDEEVEMKQQSGFMYHFKVEVVERRDALPPGPTNEQGRAGAHPSEWVSTGMWLTIATTRPETIPGDTAVAVNPKDARYAHLIGKHVRRPLPVQIPDEQKLIPIVGDDHVDYEFGTGVLKVTPAHDKADFEIGLRHKLPVVDVMNPDGTMNALAGESLVGLDRFEARKVAVEKLRELEVLVKEEPYQNNVGFSERAGVPIEPRLSEQWFLKYPSVEQARACVEQASPSHAEKGSAGFQPVESGILPDSSDAGWKPAVTGRMPALPVSNAKMRFFPERWAKVYDHWLEGIQDWCISRQLWWGHRIPVWYRKVAQASRLPSPSTSEPSARSTFLAFDQYADIDVTRRNLPHWQQPGRTYFITFRLADSLPAQKIAELEDQRETWLKFNPQPWTEAQRKEYYDRFSAKIEELLDAGSGSCLLRESQAAKIVADALLHFDKQRYDLGSWVVMPNHVHALVTPREGHALSEILHSWKSFTAHEINRHFERQGAVWQHESYDHIVRDEEALHRIEEYIDQNPEKAGIEVTQASRLRVGDDRKRDACATDACATDACATDACATIWCDIVAPPDPENWTQDPDVLDTWFSSWLWPFATMGWPEKTDTLAKFYPTTDLVTGPDIIFFWVARMIMAGYEWMGDLPFKNVYFTGIIRDKQGRKMSKSLGNSPDPLDLIAKYGADALRFGVMRSAPLGADILFDEKNVELGRNFCTKLWNATRFRQMQGGATEGEIQPALLNSDDRWILARLSDAIGDVSTALDEYRFSDATATLYRFFWNEFCDWYLETCKAVFFHGEDEARKANTLAVIDFVLAHTLRIFHPFLPFITEEIWNSLGFNSDLPANQGGETIMTAPWPKAFDADERAYFGIDEASEKFANAKYEVVNLGRSLRRDFNIASNKRVRFVLRPNGQLTTHDTEVLRILLNAEPLDVLTDYTAPKGTPVALTPLGELLLPLEGLIDVAAERERLAKELIKVEQELAKVRAKLADENFAAKVPAKVLDEHRQRESDWAEKYAQLSKMREALGEA